jgi:hypothetical protein
MKKCLSVAPEWKEVAEMVTTVTGTLNETKAVSQKP